MSLPDDDLKLTHPLMQEAYMLYKTLDYVKNQTMKDTQTPQEEFYKITKARNQLEYFGAVKADIEKARRVTAEYATGKKIKEEMMGQWLIEGSSPIISSVTWNPQTDYNQLLMVVEKAMNEELINSYKISKLTDSVMCACDLGTRVYVEVHEKEIIAILFAVTKAIESIKNK